MPELIACLFASVHFPPFVLFTFVFHLALGIESFSSVFEVAVSLAMP